MIGRLLIISSLLLVVITVIFTQFMNAEKFWQGKAVDLEVRLMENGLDKDTKKKLESKMKEFDEIHDRQKMYGKIFGGLAGTLLLINAFCLPIGEWKNSTFIVRSVAFIFMLLSIFLVIVAFAFAFSFWSP